jgi:hypothetical protein
MLRTMELLVGLAPLTQFDAFATPMGHAFSTLPNTATYGLLSPKPPGGGSPGSTPASTSASTPARTSATAAPPMTGPIATATNSPDAPMAAQSDAQNLTVEDAIDEDTFNRAIWASVHGPGSVMPAPRHTIFADVVPGPAASDDGDH